MRPTKLETWMWARAQEALEDVARMQREFCTLAPAARVPSWSPPVDVFEVEGGLVVMVVVPGVDPRRLEVQLEAGVLRIAGPRELPAGLHGARVLHMEIPLGYYERSIRLPAGRYQVREVALADGLLQLHLTRDGEYGR